MSIYGKDLAYIHDVGFGEFARQATPGIWAAQAVLAGYRVLGIDISAAMIEIAIRRAPEADFKVDSLFEVPLPDSRAVTAIGESLSYLAEDGRGEDRLRSLFQRVYASLSPGGVFIFDLVEPGEGRGLATRELLEIGFETRTLSGYGSMKLPENHTGFIARKPR